jgi:hypothetical protein
LVLRLVLDRPGRDLDGLALDHGSTALADPFVFRTDFGLRYILGAVALIGPVDATIALLEPRGMPMAGSK